MWRNRIAGSRVPEAIAASMYGCSRKVSTSERTSRTTRGTSVIVIAMMTF